MLESVSTYFAVGAMLVTIFIFIVARLLEIINYNSREIATRIKKLPKSVPLNSLEDTRFRVSPESIGRIAGFLLPRAIRERCFEPYFEELKLDRIEKKRIVKGKFANGLVETMFYARLAGTYATSLLYAIGGGLSKISPIVRWFIKG